MLLIMPNARGRASEPGVARQQPPPPCLLFGICGLGPGRFAARGPGAAGGEHSGAQAHPYSARARHGPGVSPGPGPGPGGHCVAACVCDPPPPKARGKGQGRLSAVSA
jgi:hypothetical protein